MGNTKNNGEIKIHHETYREEHRIIIKDHVWMYEPRIIYFKEVKNPTPDTAKLFFNYIEELGDSLDKWGLLVDLSEASRPDAKTRRVINENFYKIMKKTTHVSYYTKGILLQTAIRFIMFGVDKNLYTIESNFDKALSNIRNTQNQ